MLGIIAAVLIVLWLLGFFAFHGRPRRGLDITCAAFHERQYSKRVDHL
jgi:Family of unknown function (DUF5670)